MHRKIVPSVGVALLLLLLAAPAMASHPYVAAASAQGLELSIGGQDLEIGFSEAAVQSGPSDDGCGTTRGRSCARAAGAVTLGGTAEAHAPGSPGPHDVAAFALPTALAPLLTGEISAARAQAASETHAGSARGSAGGIGATFTAAAELVAGGELQAAVEAIAATLPADEDTADDEVLAALRTALDQIVVDLAAAPLARLSGGASASSAADTGGVTTATATTGESVLVVAPTARSTPSAPEGLVIVEVGESSVEARSDQRIGRTALEAPAVTISVYNPATRAYDVEELAAGGSACAAEGTPLETCVAVGTGREAVKGAGAAAAVPGVTIRALAAPASTLELTIGEASAAVASALPRPAPAKPTPSRRLHATGGGLLDTLPVGGAAVAGLALLGLAAVTRTRRS